MKERIPRTELVDFANLCFMQGKVPTVSMMKDYLKQRKPIKQENGNTTGHNK
jgi:hypothetical protein